MSGENERKFNINGEVSMDVTELAELLTTQGKTVSAKDSEHVLEPYKQILNGAQQSEDYNGHKPIDCSWPWRQTVINCGPERCDNKEAIT